MSPSRKRRILFVDDDPIIRRVADKMLRILGCESIIASSAEKALEMYQEDPAAIDILITDQHMPRMSGGQLRASVRETDTETKVVVITGDEGTMTQVRLEEDPNLFLLPKPYSLDCLREVIREATNA